MMRSRVGRCFDKPSLAILHLTLSSVMFSMEKSLSSVMNHDSGCSKYAAKLTGLKGFKCSVVGCVNCVEGVVDWLLVELG